MGMTRTLNSREAERLFKSWGFVPVKNKGRSVGGHVFFAYLSPDGPRASITAPGRKHGTPEVSYRKAAQIVGVTTQEFLLGPGEYARTHGEQALAALKDLDARRRGAFDGSTVLAPTTTNTTSPDLPVVEEQTMTSGAVQTPVAEFADRVHNVLKTAEAPLSYSSLNAAAGLQYHRGESVARALEYLAKQGVEVKEEYRRAKGGRPFKVIYIVGSPAEALAHKVEEKVEEVVTEVEVEDKVEEKKEPMSYSERGRIAGLAHAERTRAEMEERALKVAEFVASAPEPQTRYEIAEGLGLSYSQAGRAIREAVKTGLVFHREAEHSEYTPGLKTGRMGTLYFGDPSLPERKTKIMTVSGKTIEEVVDESTPVEAATPTPVLDLDIPAIQILRVKPDGSLVLIDAAGDLYLAKKVAV